MAVTKIPTAVDLVIKEFTGSGITEYSSGIKNGVAQKLANGQIQVTQRPSFDIFEDSSAVSGLSRRGRGIYFWEQNSTLYFVENDTVYRDSYSNTVGTISAGSESIYFHEGMDAGGNQILILIDAENNNAKKITLGHTLTSFAPTNFPSTLVHGGAVLNQTLYVMDEDGVIYNSATGNFDSFPAAGFIEAERDNDKGVYLGRHHESIIALGTRTIEFFYDAGNKTGSPLNRRSDIFHNMGCADGVSVWENGDTIYFIGSNPDGALGVYRIDRYIPTKVSTDSIDSYINFNATQETAYYFAGTGVTLQGHSTYILTVYTLPSGDVVPPITAQATITYDSLSKLWGIWDSHITSHAHFPLISWTKRTGGFNSSTSARAGEGILANGDLITINDNLIPKDTLLGLGSYFADGYIEDGYFTFSTPDVADNIELNIRTGQWDGNTNVLKFQKYVKPTLERTATSQALTLSWNKTDEQEGNNMTSGRSLDTSKREYARQGGKFTKRNFNLNYKGDEQLYINDLEIDVVVGNE